MFINYNIIMIYIDKFYYSIRLLYFEGMSINMRKVDFYKKSY